MATQKKVITLPYETLSLGNIKLQGCVWQDNHGRLAIQCVY
jgi:hypothetical protein